MRKRNEKTYKMIGLGKKYSLLLNCDEEQWNMFTDYGVANNFKNGILMVPDLLEWCTWHGIKTAVLPWKLSLFGHRTVAKLNKFAKEHNMLLSVDEIHQALEALTKQVDIQLKAQGQLDPQAQPQA